MIRLPLRVKNIVIGMVILLTASYSLVSPSFGCTIFTVTDGEVVLFGNNEDNFQSLHGRIWSFPAVNNKYGLVLFGFRLHDDFDIPVGGVNDQGLCVDMNGIPRPPLTVHSEKEYFSGSFKKILEDCSTVAEVKEWVKTRDMPFLQSEQAHFADKTGDAAVMGLNSDGETYFTNRTTNYLISTNFNLAQESNNGQCWRYTRAEEMLGNMDSVTVDNSKQVLNITALPIIMYSYVIDLTNGLIYLYTFGDFNRVAVLSIEELVNKADSFEIESLISQQTGTMSYLAFNNLILSLFFLGLFVVIFILVYVFRIHPDLFDGSNLARNPSEVESSKFKSILAERHPVIRFILFITVFSSLFVVGKILTIPFYLDLEYISVTITVQISLVFIIICIAGVANRPSIAFFTSSIGLLLSEIIFWLLHENSTIELPIYMLLSVSSFGGAVLIISLLREKNKVFAMALGYVWASVIWYIVAGVYYTNILSLGTEHLQFCMMILSIINLVLLPIAIMLNKVVEVLFKVTYLDELLFIST